jgi:hypothetical protein
MSTYLSAGSLIFGLIFGIKHLVWGGLGQAISVYFASVSLIFGVQPVVDKI